MSPVARARLGPALPRPSGTLIYRAVTTDSSKRQSTKRDLGPTISSTIMVLRVDVDCGTPESSTDSSPALGIRPAHGWCRRSAFCSSPCVATLQQPCKIANERRRDGAPTAPMALRLTGLLIPSWDW